MLWKWLLWQRLAAGHLVLEKRVSLSQPCQHGTVISSEINRW